MRKLLTERFSNTVGHKACCAAPRKGVAVVCRQEPKGLVRLPLHIQPDRSTEVAQQAHSRLIRQACEREALAPAIHQQNQGGAHTALQACAVHDALGACSRLAAALAAAAAFVAAFVLAGPCWFEVQRQVPPIRADQTNLRQQQYTAGARCVSKQSARQLWCCFPICQRW